MGMRHGGVRVKLVELIIKYNEAIFKGSREELDDAIRRNVEFTPQVEEHLIRFSQALKRDSITLARSLVEEGETEMAVCFESFSDIPNLDDWKRVNEDLDEEFEASDEEEKKAESDKRSRVDSDPLVRLRTDLASPRHRKRSSKSHPGKGSPNNSDMSSEEQPVVRGSVGSRWRKRRRTKQVDSNNPSFLKPEHPLRQDHSPNRRISKRLSVDLISPRERLKVEKYHSTPVQFSSSVQLFFDPRSTEEIAESWNVQPGKMFEMIINGNTEGVRDTLAPLNKDDRFLLVFRLQRAATDLIITLNEAK